MSEKDLNIFLSDIPLSLAVSAHSGTSFTPEKRGDRERIEYAETLQADYDFFWTQADKGGTLHLLEDEFSRYRSGYADRYRAYLQSQSRIVSTMIAGPSNFPARRMNKRSEIASRRLTDLIEFRERARKAVQRTLRPDLRPIMSGDSDAVQRLRAELEKLETLQAQMKAINVAHKAFLKNPHSLEAADLPESVKQTIRQYEPLYSWEPHPVPPFRLTNNGANIRRIKQRIADLEKVKAIPETEQKYEGGIRVEVAPADNRVRLFFPDKPSADIRARLKSGGFRWAPSVGAWQAYINHRTTALANEVAASAA